nr:hypothetical protein [Tanacetum cinerariifolium]
SVSLRREDYGLSESVDNHPNSVVALRRLRKFSDKIHGDVVPLPFRYILACLSIGSVSLRRKDYGLSESVDNHPNSVVALRRLRKFSDKIHGDVVPLPFRYLRLYQ